MSDSKYYVTTPIYYVNFKPHVGTSYTTILTDVLCRWRRLCGDETLLVTGSDEHSQNIADLAAEAGLAPRAYCDTIIPKFKQCWELLEIQDYHFERTSDPKHHRVTQAFWQRIHERGDVYKGEYAGWYHTTDNRYLDEDEVPEQPETHPRLKYLTEEAYYFRLSKYQSWLLEFYAEQPGFVIPDFRRNEMLRRIEQGLRDICISRTSTDWGIPLPWDKGHVFYVWVEALLTYLTGSGFDIDAYLRAQAGTASRQDGSEALPGQGKGNFWPADLHVMAKDIPWFHAVIWPAMLHSFGLPPPRRILVHGYWQFDGEKMSKSLGNVVDPYDAAKLVGVDGLRYFLVREVPAGRDGNFNYSALIDRYNFDLVNDLGNLVHRTLSLLHQLFEGILPPAELAADDPLEQARQAALAETGPHYDGLRFSEAMQQVWALVRQANQYIDQVRPWDLKSKPDRRPEVAQAFHRLANAIRTVIQLAYPVIPGAATRFWRVLNLPATPEEQRLADLKTTLTAGHRFNPSQVVFKRVDKKALEKSTTPVDGGTKAATNARSDAVPADTDSIETADFGRIALRVAEIRKAERVPKADRLLRLEVFDGERVRQVVSGIAAHYKAEELLGKRVVLVANLKPAKLRGVVSEGMLLAAEANDGTLALISPERPLPAGARVR